VSTPRPLTVRGTFRDAVVRGAARLERGRIYIPELIDKRIVDLNEYRDVVDTTVFRDRQLLPGAPSAFVEGLTLDDVTLSVGNDVWLRSPETNIKLGGTPADTRAAARDRTQPTQLALLGALDVERGTYRLNLLPLAQPVFDVFPGTLRFFGTGDLNPTLDVQAVHVVRQLRQTSNRPDVRVQVNIGGTLNQPTLRLSSADNPPISDTDLISYLVTGEPAAAFFGQAEGNTSGAAAASIVSRLAGSLVSGALSRGGPFDIVQVQTGSVTADPAQQRAAGDNIASILASTRLGVGGQLGNRTFYTFSTGFCGLRAQEQQQGFLTSFYRGLGFRVERRITPSVSVQGSVEPGSQQLACLNDNSRFFFQQTPPQVGLDVSKTWSF
jgi:translocation and assembly module TamB